MMVARSEARRWSTWSEGVEEKRMSYTRAKGTILLKRAPTREDKGVCMSCPGVG